MPANYRRGMYDRRGFGPRQGIPGIEALSAQLDRADAAQEHYAMYHLPEYGDDRQCYDPHCRYNADPDL
jgi:hypothetical protein